MDVILAYLAGLLTILSPCILPVLPFVLVRIGQPFRHHGFPMLAGMAVAFTAVASLAAFAGNWAIEWTEYGRVAALLLLAMSGLALLVPALSTRLIAPLLTIGTSLTSLVDERVNANGRTFSSSVLLGVATGLIWAPCAGPILGLVLAGAALRGPSLETSLLLLAYASGAATSLAAALLSGGHLLGTLKRWLTLGDWPRRALGIGVLASVLAIMLGLDTGILTRISSPPTAKIEQALIGSVRSVFGVDQAARAFAAPANATLAADSQLFGTASWINHPPLTKKSIENKVVLVNFWTYSCINCLRALPYVRAWAEKYQASGLVVIGVHTPEFAFEKDKANVGKAVASLGINYPVVIDNDYAIWHAFGNRAWPAFYFIGIDGRVRHHLLGEGSYTEAERLIQQLLAEGNKAPLAADLVAPIGQGPQAAADRTSQQSAETYLGYAQATNFASPGGVNEDTPSLYRSPSTLPLNRWSLAGNWSIEREFTTLRGASGNIRYRFHARDLHLVLGPPEGGRSVRFRVMVDGAPPGADHGTDVNPEGWGNVTANRLFQLVRQTGTVTDRTFDIEFFGAGVRAYAFTFG